MKRLPLADYDTKQLEDFSRYVFVMSEVGLRQKDMAKQLDVSRWTIIAIESDKYNPTLELAMKMAKLLNLHVDEIFFLDEWK